MAPTEVEPEDIRDVVAAILTVAVAAQMDRESNITDTHETNAKWIIGQWDEIYRQLTEKAEKDSGE